MSGKSPELSLYFHIPFCTRKCPYCHFYVIPNSPTHRKQLLAALLQELEMRRPEIERHSLVSIYFGGGTPTLFGAEPIGSILKAIGPVSSDCEVTIEANPEDVTLPLMQSYRAAGINRVSLGVQSLVDDSLIQLERTHSASKALSAIEATHSAGITNISIDLMMELPNQSVASFEKTLSQLDNLPITHLSLYHLTIEPHTPFSKRKLNLPSEEEGLEMLKRATETLSTLGFERYEISAFAKEGLLSRHNTGYWLGRPFFGLGPSAFSYFDGKRFRNVANLNRYCRGIDEGRFPIDFEEALCYPDSEHERLAVALRMLQGVKLDAFSLPSETKKTLQRLEEEGLLAKEEGRLKLSEKGLLFYDSVATEII